MYSKFQTYCMDLKGWDIEEQDREVEWYNQVFYNKIDRIINLVLQLNLKSLSIGNNNPSVKILFKRITPEKFFHVCYQQVAEFAFQNPHIFDITDVTCKKYENHQYANDKIMNIIESTFMSQFPLDQIVSTNTTSSKQQTSQKDEDKPIALKKLEDYYDQQQMKVLNLVRDAPKTIIPAETSKHQSVSKPNSKSLQKEPERHEKKTKTHSMSDNIDPPKESHLDKMIEETESLLGENDAQVKATDDKKPAEIPLTRNNLKKLEDQNPVTLTKTKSQGSKNSAKNQGIEIRQNTTLEQIQLSSGAPKIQIIAKSNQDNRTTDNNESKKAISSLVKAQDALQTIPAFQGIPKQSMKPVEPQVPIVQRPTMARSITTFNPIKLSSLPQAPIVSLTTQNDLIPKRFMVGNNGDQITMIRNIPSEKTNIIPDTSKANNITASIPIEKKLETYVPPVVNEPLPIVAQVKEEVKVDETLKETIQVEKAKVEIVDKIEPIVIPSIVVEDIKVVDKPTEEKKEEDTIVDTIEPPIKSTVEDKRSQSNSTRSSRTESSSEKKTRSSKHSDDSESESESEEESEESVASDHVDAN
jgi:hypothetical protein